MSAAGPWHKGKNGEVIINWDYASDDGITLKEKKLKWTKELIAERGEAWVQEAKARLDDEFEMMVSMGLLT